MKQNIYDNPVFFERYIAYRDNPLCYNNILERPAMSQCLPPLQGYRIIDIGSGVGGFCREVLTRGADSVLGIDISRRMCEEAARRISDDRVQIFNQAIEDYNYRGPLVDLIASSLTLHYVADFAAVLKKIISWLKPNGRFLFSVNHPMLTADLHYVPDFETSKELEVRVARYYDEGPRPHYWLVDGVVKYHRSLQTYVDTLHSVGLYLQRIVEPKPSTGREASIQNPAPTDDLPVFILFSTQKDQSLKR